MKLSKYIKPYIGFIILSPLLMLLEVFMDLQQPTLMSVIVDDGILAVNNGGEMDPNMDLIIFTSIKMLICALIGMVGGVGCTYFSSKASQNFGADLRADLFRKITAFSFAETDKFTTGSLVTRTTNDVTQLQNLVMMALRMFVRTPMLCFGGIVMALSINLRFGLILLVTLPVMILLVALIIKNANPFFTKVQDKIDKLNGIMQENLSGVRVVKAYVREDYETEKFETANYDLAKTTLTVSRLLAVLSPVMMLIMNATTIAVIYFGALQVQDGIIGVGEVMAVVTYMAQILMSMMMMSMMFMAISRGKASYDRIKAVMETDPSVVSGSSDAEVKKGSIEFKNVSFRYPFAVGDPVIKNVSLKIDPGETVAFLGSTGSGKSSLVNLIPHFYDTTEGEVLVDGINVNDYNLENLRAGIGMVLQEAVLFSGTIMENIKWGDPNASDEDAIEAAKTAQADDFITSLPDGYSTMLGQRGLTLSGGQKQRLSISRAVLKKPKILILDDSTSALDMGTEARLQNALKQKMKGMTSLIIAQRISSVMYADKIVVLDKGEISAIGTHEELLNTSDIYKDIYDSQVGQGGIENV
ncbi:MAG: ABC transporter ATP-binding protein [Clostridia bacterium]|nr:ABC transporter ATP-binding protein [Clostridia bacterium]